MQSFHSARSGCTALGLGSSSLLVACVGCDMAKRVQMSDSTSGGVAQDFDFGGGDAGTEGGNNSIQHFAVTTHHNHHGTKRHRRALLFPTPPCRPSLTPARRDASTRKTLAPSSLSAMARSACWRRACATHLLGCRPPADALPSLYPFNQGTNVLSKALMPVGNVPIINIVLDWVFAGGLTGESCCERAATAGTQEVSLACSLALGRRAVPTIRSADADTHRHPHHRPPHRRGRNLRVPRADVLVLLAPPRAHHAQELHGRRGRRRRGRRGCA